MGMSTERPSSIALGRIFLVALIVIVGIGLINLALNVIKIWNFTVDDAFITFRYSENLAKGWGLTFNYELPRAEGYTSFLWTLIMAAVLRMGFPAAMASKTLGLGFTMLAVAATVSAACSVLVGTSRLVRITGGMISLLLFLSFPYVPLHAVSGMETALAVLLYACVSAIFCILTIDPNLRWVSLLAIFCFLLGITRPEANLFCGCLLLLGFLGWPRTRKLSFILICTSLYVLPGIIYFGWRFQYYGLLFPLPFYVKSSNLGLAGFLPTLGFIWRILPEFALPLILSTVLKRSLALKLLVPTGILFAYFANLDQIMGYGYRYLYPLIPPLCILGGVGVASWLHENETRLFRKTALLLATLLVIAATLASGVIQNMPDTADYVSYAEGLKGAHVLLGQTLRGIAWHTPNPVLVIADAGAVPYYSRLFTIDSFGLNDPYIATHLHQDRSSYILAAQPTIIVLISRSAEHLDSPFSFENTLYALAIERGYSSKAIFVFRKDYYLWVLWRATSPDATSIEKVLSAASIESFAISQ